MSGGSWSYVCFQIDEAAERLRGSRDPRRRLLGERLAVFGPALKAIEWHDSADWGPEDESRDVEAALAALGVPLDPRREVADELRRMADGLDGGAR